MTDSTVSEDVGSSNGSCIDEKIPDLNKSPDKIIYSEGGSKAARHSTGVFFTLDSKTNMPTPLDEGGFFRVGIDASNPKWLWMYYRIERKFWRHFHFKWLSSRQVDYFTITIGSEREIEHDDILNAALKLSENRQKEIFRKNAVTVRSPLQKWVGDYPPNNLSISEKDK